MTHTPAAAVLHLLLSIRGLGPGIVHCATHTLTHTHTRTYTHTHTHSLTHTHGETETPTADPDASITGPPFLHNTTLSSGLLNRRLQHHCYFHTVFDLTRK